MAGRPGVTSIIEAGMDAASLRAKVIANNLANMETANFRRSDVRFEELLADAMEHTSGREGEAELKVQPEVFQPMTNPVDAKGNDVTMEGEIGQMIQNGEKYKAYVRMLSKVYKQMDMAMGM